ncbi:unnamed protein product, partial [Vitis vinifera]
MNQVFGHFFKISGIRDQSHLTFERRPKHLTPKRRTGPHLHPKVNIIDFLNTPSELPPWIIEKELQFSASKFQQSGFTGALNYYRAMDMNWELLGAWQGVKITTPTKFIVGDEDVGFEAFGRGDYIKGKAFKGLVPNMEVVVIGGHHHIQIEKAERVTSEILSFFGEW